MRVSCHWRSAVVPAGGLSAFPWSCESGYERAVARDDFTAPTKKRLAGRAGHRCSNPDCQAPTIGPQPGGDGVINLGEGAHITAAAPGGPRYDDSLSPEQRRDDANGIWLCANHAKAVDSDPKQFTIDLLKSWKSTAEKCAFDELMGRGKPPADSLVGSIAEIRTKALTAAQKYNASFTEGPRWPSHPVKLNLRLVRDTHHESFDADTLAEATASFNRLVILAPPGTGKSTSLLQTVQAICGRRGVPAVFVPLGEWSASGKSLIEFVLAAHSFASCKRDDLDALASEGELLLALDGWNELDQSSRKKASAEISGLRRGFPDLGFIVSTRRQALDVPISGIQVEIDVLTEEQQLKIARAARVRTGRSSSIRLGERPASASWWRSRSIVEHFSAAPVMATSPKPKKNSCATLYVSWRRSQSRPRSCAAFFLGATVIS